MSDIKLFAITQGSAQELAGSAAALEKSLQTVMEMNLNSMLGVRFLCSEYSTGPRHGGRIDTLGIDENGSPVIIEYKRSTNENVINQGLYYLDWLLDHQAEFKLLVTERLGQSTAESLDWSAPRLICIAGNFTKYDGHAVRQINRNIELIRYRQFGDQLLLLELVNATTTKSTPTANEGAVAPESSGKTISEVLRETPERLLDIYEELRAFLAALGDDVQEKTLKFYIAFKRIKNFACIEIHPSKGSITTFVKVNPDDVHLEDGFTRDVRKIGHLGTGDLEVTLRSRDDLERAKQLYERSYESS